MLNTDYNQNIIKGKTFFAEFLIVICIQDRKSVV